MKFITVRDLRSRSAEVWRKLREEQDLVITSNGKPIAIVSATDEDHFEQTLGARRQARALCAVKELQERSVKRGLDRLGREDIEAEIRGARKGRRR
ncbi:MAG TPA: type II toxin-antitoxin system prevent-host-death family antitoxin [Phycisphaerae bacterium]|nr:type II toxin-antitoxin system prevent-host-death family antitoxin [Phycisphaerae bacterium]